MNELLRAALVIARRDFAATVFSKSFLLFLLAPLFPVMIGLIFGGLTMTAGRGDLPTVAVVAGEQDFAALAAAHERAQSAFRGAPMVQLRRVEPAPDPDSLRRRLLVSEDRPVIAVLEGGLAHPRLTGGVRHDGSAAGQLALMIDHARRTAAGPDAQAIPLVVSHTGRSSAVVASQRTLTARAGQAALFVLTILLATMLLSQLIEEKSNKIIEVLAAAVPIGAIFLGKLLAMLTMSLLGIAVWVAAGAAAVALIAEQGLASLPPPAVGWPVFLSMAVVYFAMSYLLLGAIFLGVGGHASTAREVQTLSMPVTMAQILVFAFASLAIGDPDGAIGLGAAIFPLSSPYVMLARGAELPQLWPHLAAIAWQLAWVAIFLATAARLFRRSVLKSGAPPRWRRVKA